MPRAQPAALAEVARRLCHVAADPAAPDRLLLRPRSRARHTRGAQPVRRRLARRRPQPTADEETARPARSDRADPCARRPARARVPAPLRDVAGRGRARSPARDPALRRRPCTRMAGHENRQPARLRRRRRAARARLRRLRRARRPPRPPRAAQRDGDREARPRRQRPRQRPHRRSARARRECARPRALARGHRGHRPRLPRRARRPGRHRRGADRGQGLPQPERAAADQPVGPGRHPLDARSGARRPERPDLLRLPLPRRPGVRAPDRGRGAEGGPPARARRA